MVSQETEPAPRRSRSRPEGTSMDIRTESRNVTMVPQWQEEIEGRLHDLQDGHNDILHARMILERNRHHNKGPKIAMARLVCNVRGGTFTASKTEETFEEAIRATFNAMEEELRTFREKRKQRARVESARRKPSRRVRFD
ncbi:MAG: hypothetical protein E6K68_00965 [Nitrospirae bacterium]|nr:MAG: hypothetical protein E6K68_00965 [Nitrospirota bacterium]